MDCRKKIQGNKIISEDKIIIKKKQQKKDESANTIQGKRTRSIQTLLGRSMRKFCDAT